MGNTNRRIVLNSETNAKEDNTLKELAKTSGFTYKQLVSLQMRFNELGSKSERTAKTLIDYIKPEDLLRIPEFKRNPLHDRIVDVFFSDCPQSGTRLMDFQQFATVLGKFRGYSGTEESIRVEKKKEKMTFLFKIYDTDSDGVINSRDMFDILKKTMSDNEAITDDTIEKMAKQAVNEMDVNGDGVVSIQDFFETMKSIDLDSKLNLGLFNIHF